MSFFIFYIGLLFALCLAFGAKIKSVIEPNEAKRFYFNHTICERTLDFYTKRQQC